MSCHDYDENYITDKQDWPGVNTEVTVTYLHAPEDEKIFARTVRKIKELVETTLKRFR